MQKHDCYAITIPTWLPSVLQLLVIIWASSRSSVLGSSDKALEFCRLLVPQGHECSLRSFQYCWWWYTCSFNSYTDKNLGSFDRIIIYEKLRKYQNMIFIHKRYYRGLEGWWLRSALTTFLWIFPWFVCKIKRSKSNTTKVLNAQRKLSELNSPVRRQKQRKWSELNSPVRRQKKVNSGLFTSLNMQ